MNGENTVSAVLWEAARTSCTYAQSSSIVLTHLITLATIVAVLTTHYINKMKHCV